MANIGKCAKCENIIESVRIETVEVTQSRMMKWKGASYICPHCETVLSVSIDLLALKTDIINGVVKSLRR